MATSQSVQVLTPRLVRAEATPAEMIRAIDNLSKQLFEIRQELTSIKEVMVALALRESMRPGTQGKE